MAPFNVTRPLIFCEWMWVGHQTNAQRQSLEVCHDQLFENIKLWVCGMFMHYMFVNQCLALSVVVFGLSAMCAYVQSFKYLL